MGGTGVGSLPSPLLAVPNVTALAHLSTANLPISVFLYTYNGPLLFGFNVSFKGLLTRGNRNRWLTNNIPKRPKRNLSNEQRNINKCVSKTDTNPPFAFQIAFPRSTDFAGFLQGGSKSRDLQSEISVRIESRIESADSRLQLQCSFFFDCRIGQMCGFVKTIARSLLGYYCACSNYKYMN